MELANLSTNHTASFRVQNRTTVQAELGKLLYESNILHITGYFYQEVIYYSYILLHQKSNFIILLYYFIAFKSNNIM